MELMDHESHKAACALLCGIGLEAGRIETVHSSGSISVVEQSWKLMLWIACNIGLDVKSNRSAALSSVG